MLKHDFTSEYAAVSNKGILYFIPETMRSKGVALAEGQ